MDAWLGATRGKRALQMSVLAAEREHPSHYWELLEFPSEGDARDSVELPETEAAYERWTKLLDAEPEFHDLDVLEQYGGPWPPPWTPSRPRRPEPASARKQPAAP